MSSPPPHPQPAAHRDALTGLPAPDLFHDRLRQAMAGAARRGRELAVVYLDIDHFSDVNRRLGDALGDRLLVAFAERLETSVRRSDSVARLGADAFALLLGDLDGRRECLALLERLMQHIAEPLSVGEVSLRVTASAGLAFYSPAQEIDAEQLLRLAASAMSRAKAEGRNRFQVLDEREDTTQRAFLDRVEEAVAAGQFTLFYQPIIDLRAGTVVGAEALLRWLQSDGELLLPQGFLPRLEGHPLAQTLEQFVLERAVQQLHRWSAQGSQLELHVNAGASDFADPGFSGKLEALLKDLPPDRGTLCLEILESAAVADPALVNRTISACAPLGVTFALDDFGTGYSSLAHLKDLRTRCVKIDQRFVQAMFSSFDDFSLLAAIVAMSRAFGRTVIAEGVETGAQARMLLRLGCDMAQGFALARPMPAETFDRWRAAWQPDPAWSVVLQDEARAGDVSIEASRAAWEQAVAQLA